MAKPTQFLLLFLLALLLHSCAEQPLPLPAEPLSENLRLDSTTFLRNAAVAYFNEGAKIHAAYAQMWEAVERGSQKPVGAEYRSRSEACAYFAKAQEINALLPDTFQLWYVRDASLGCAPGASAVSNRALRGRLMDATTNQPLGVAALAGVRIKAEGLKPGTVQVGGAFSIDLPNNWNSPVKLTVIASGYKPQNLTVPNAQQNITVSLTPAVPGDPPTTVAVTPSPAPDLTDGDGDGIPNAQDNCPTEKGTAENKGCPPPATANKQREAIAEIERNMVRIPAGSFLMGCDSERDGNCQMDEKPTRKVTLRTFALSKFEVTESQWAAIMEEPLRNASCPSCPVADVSWEDAQRFVQKLNDLTTFFYDLPTEAEWEYAARGGATNQYAPFAGADAANLGNIAWYAANSKGETHPVGKKKDNTIGLFDMNGNVSEWCRDWADSYDEQDTNNPKGPAKGRRRACRGGSFLSPERDCRVANRNSFLPDSRHGDVGFRLAKATK